MPSIKSGTATRYYGKHRPKDNLTYCWVNYADRLEGALSRIIAAENTIKGQGEDRGVVLDRAHKMEAEAREALGLPPGRGFNEIRPRDES